MVDKIKHYAQLAYGFVVALLLGVVYYFFQRNKSLEAKNSELKADINVAAILNEGKAQKERADRAEEDYHSIVNKFNVEPNDDGSGKTN